MTRLRILGKPVYIFHGADGVTILEYVWLLPRDVGKPKLRGSFNEKHASRTTETEFETV